MATVSVPATISWGRHPWLLLLCLSILCICTTVSPSSQSPCSDLVPEATPVDTKKLEPNPFRIQSGYFRPQGKFLGLDPLPNTSYSPTRNSMVQFIPRHLSETTAQGLLHLKGILVFRTRGFFAVPSNTNMSFSRRNRQFDRFSDPLWRSVALGGVWIFELEGYWSESDGRVCMTGSGKSFTRGGNVTLLSSVLMLNYPKNLTILTSLVTGTLESLGDNHFDPISIVGYNQNEHIYTLIPKAKKMCASVGAREESLRLSSIRSVCSMLSSVNQGFELEYGNGCASRNCNPLGKGFDFLPRFVAFGAMTCSDNGKIQMYMTFFNTSYYGHSAPFAPSTTFVGEGFWDETKNRLCFLACRVMNSTKSLTDAFVGDCTVGMCLRFPATLSIRNRSSIVGYILSTRNMNESGYFDRIAFRNLGNSMADVSGFKYKYTKIDWVRRLCSLKRADGNATRKYPTGASFRDLRFGIHLNSDSGFIRGYLTPLFIGDRSEVDHRGALIESSAASASEPSQKLWNVSYVLSFKSFSYGRGTVVTPLMKSMESDRQIGISAEGIYDASTGRLCMSGCRYLHQNFLNLSSEVDSMDCEIFINVQYPPLDMKAGERLDGTIKSTRYKSDPLYFEPLEFYSSIPYIAQTRKMIKRMDLEIIMVLVTLTLACLSVASQLFYIKRHPDVLPSVSLLMIIILTLGHMIPLVLNFEAVFWGKSKKNVLLWSSGWIEVNEVIVRVITMVAFLLQLRLLQLVVSARLVEMSEKGLLAGESKVLKWCLPLYLLGVLVALVVHFMKSSPASRAHHSLWEYLLSYSGLVLDGFLLPQVILNLFSNSKGKALAITFYVGTTLVRALPHAYDAYRAHSYLPQLEGSFIYADTKRDFYSTVWDFIIPVGGLLLAVIISLQQKFGGGCILPSKLRRIVEYELVPRSDG